MPRPEDPGRPSSILPQRRCCCVGFRCVQTVAVCFMALTRLYQTSGKCAFPCGLHGSLCTLRMLRSVLFHLLHTRNTRYGWVARPSPAGTCTLQETPRCAWRTNARLQARLEAGARNERTLEAVSSRPLFGLDSASKTWETDASEVFPQEPVPPACVFYFSGRRYFATASSPICLPMAVPTSVEVR